MLSVFSCHQVFLDIKAIQYLKDEFKADRRISGLWGMMTEKTAQWLVAVRRVLPVIPTPDWWYHSAYPWWMILTTVKVVSSVKWGAAILGNLLSIKPILHFNDEGVIGLWEEVGRKRESHEKLALRRDCCIRYTRWSLPRLCHTLPNVWKAEALRQRYS